MIQVFFTGHLGADAGPVSDDQQYGPRVSFSVAARCKEGRQTEQTIWFKCTLWGNRANAVAQYLTKGKQVGIVGELSEDTWTTNQGEARKDFAVRVNQLDLLGPAPSQNQPQGPAYQGNPQPPQGHYQQPPAQQPPPMTPPQTGHGYPTPQQQPPAQQQPQYQPSDGGDQRGPGGYTPPDVPF